jgi:hypothetical protein
MVLCVRWTSPPELPLVQGMRSSAGVVTLSLVPTVQRVEKQIKAFEGFDVKILHLDGRDARGDLSGLPGYSHYRRRAAKTSTVRDWMEARFKPRYPGYGVVVFLGDGSRAHGNTRLRNVLATYK